MEHAVVWGSVDQSNFMSLGYFHLHLKRWDLFYHDDGIQKALLFMSAGVSFSIYINMHMHIYIIYMIKADRKAKRGETGCNLDI